MLYSQYNALLYEALTQQALFSDLNIEVIICNEEKLGEQIGLGGILICDTPLEEECFPNCIVLQNDITLPCHLDDLVEMLLMHVNNLIYTLKKGVFFMPQKRIIQYHDLEMLLTEKEAAILQYLCKVYPESLSVNKLLEGLWQHADDVQTNTFEVHLYRLKQKLHEVGMEQSILLKDQMISLNVL